MFSSQNCEDDLCEKEGSGTPSGGGGGPSQGLPRGAWGLRVHVQTSGQELVKDKS